MDSTFSCSVFANLLNNLSKAVRFPYKDLVIQLKLGGDIGSNIGAFSSCSFKPMANI
jgi:hypothetical protein